MVADNSYEFPNGIVLANIFCRTACKINFQNNIQKTTSAIIKSSVNHCFFDFSFNIRLNFCGETLYTCLKILDKCALDEKPVRIAISFKFKFRQAGNGHLQDAHCINIAETLHPLLCGKVVKNDIC